jgi:hypothetical protein
MLIENTLFGTRDKVAEAIQRLKSFEAVTQRAHNGFH